MYELGGHRHTKAWSHEGTLECMYVDVKSCTSRVDMEDCETSCMPKMFMKTSSREVVDVARIIGVQVRLSCVAIETPRCGAMKVRWSVCMLA
jgi:hypothetical protein